MNKAILIAALATATFTACNAAQARSIRAVGSSTVYPFTTAVAESFKRQYPQYGAPVIESTGTGGGIKLFCGGVGTSHPDIVNASRRIKASEVKTCRENGVTQVIELQVGLDGLALAHARSGANFTLSPRDVYMALAATPYGKPNKAKTWKDVNSKLPATKIEVLGPPPTSGTRDAFNDLFMTPSCELNAGLVAMKKTNEAKYKTICTKIREDGAFVEAGENDNLIVQKLVANPRAVGIFGYSYLEENLDKVKAVPINGVAPTYDSIASYTYPASRPLYVYVKGQHLRAVRGLREFLAEYSKETTWGKGGYLARRGLVASPDRVRAANAAVARGLKPMDLASVK